MKESEYADMIKAARDFSGNVSVQWYQGLSHVSHSEEVVVLFDSMDDEGEPRNSR